MPTSLRTLTFAGCFIAATSIPALAANETLNQLRETPVSMLDWGIYQLKKYISTEINLEFETWESMVPPFRVDVMYEPKYEHIKIEVGLSLDVLDRDKMQPTCAATIEKVRFLLGLDKLGHPYGWPGNSASGIATQFFQSSYTSGPAPVEMAEGVDASIYIQALIAVPSSARHAVCRAKLVDGKIEYF